MLSMASMGAGSLHYYTHLAQEDYYLSGGEPVGRWIGLGAESLGLPAEVSHEHFGSLFRGMSPDGSRELTRGAKSKHHPGWDLTFSAPKSVSVLWALRSDLRRSIQAAQFEAVKDAVAYLEHGAAITKRGAGGAYREHVEGLVVATFEHGTSRAQDPQLHTHALVLNVAKRQDETWGTVLGHPLFQEKMAAGALYRASLARALHQDLGLSILPTRTGFEVDGVPRKLIEHFSSRRREIEEELKTLGEGAEAAAYAARLTRERKAHESRERLFEKWGREARGYSIRPHENEIHRFDRDAELRKALNRALSRVERERSVFTVGDIVRLASAEALGRFGGDTIAHAVRERVQCDRTLVPLGLTNDAKYLYTTEELLELGPALRVELQSLAQRKLRSTAPLSERLIRQVEQKLVRTGKTLSEPQREALRRITTKRGGARELAGLVGAERHAVLDAARDGWTRWRPFLKRRRVIAVSPTRETAKALQAATGIWAQTPEDMLQSLKSPRGLGGAVKTVRAMGQGRLFRPRVWFRDPQTMLKMIPRLAEKPWLQIDGRTVLVIDEAKDLETKPVAELVARVKRANGTVILAHDSAMRDGPRDVARERGGR